MDVLKEVESARKVLRNQQIKADESTLLEVREASVRQKDMADIGSLNAHMQDLFDKSKLSYENWSAGKTDTAGYLSAADDIAKSARKLSNVINRIPLYYNTDESREYIETARSNLSQLISNAYSASLFLKKDGQIAYNTFADLSAAKQQYEEYVSNEEKYQEYKYAMQEREEALEYYKKQTYEMLTEEQWRGRAQDLMFLSKYPTYQDYIDAYRKGEVQAEAERRQAIATEYDKKLSTVTNEGKYKADWYGRYNYEKLFEQYGNSPDYDINVEEGKKLSSNTDVGFIREEFQNMYYYLLNTQGEVEADNYLANFDGYINYFKGLARAEELKDGSVISHAFTDIQAGLSGFWRGVKAFAFPGEYLPNSSSTYAYGINREERSWIGRLAGDVLVNVAQNAPSWLLARIPGVGAALGYGSFFATAAGNAYITAQELGVDTEQATAYSLIIGASETTLEKLLSGLNYSGGLIGERLFKDSAIQFSSTWAQAAFNVATSKFAKEVVGEFTEEYLQEILEPVFRNICFDENNEFKFFTVDAAYAGLIGALSAATHYENIQQLLKDTQYTAYAVKAGAEFQKYENVNALVENAIQLGGEVAEYARSLGDNPTAYQIGELVLKSGQQRTEIGLVNQLFDSIGYKVNVVDTLTPDGQTEIVNGHISKGKKEVTLARDANHLLSWVAKHEFVHSLENTPQYAQLRDFIVNSDHVAHILEDSGRTYEDAINGYAKVLSESQGTEYTFEDAEKEFIGDYVAQYLFNNEAYVNELVNAYRPLSSKLLASVSRLKRAAFGSKLERYFTKAERTIMKAREKVETVEAGTTADSIRTNETQESITSFFDALVIDVSPVGKFGISTSSEVTVDVVKNSKLGKVLDYALKKGNISSDDYDKQIRFIVELGEMIRKSPNPRMLWEFVGSNAFSSITSNSDPQYISTIDFGTVCVKTQELINKMSKAMIEKAKKNNGFGALTKEEIFALNGEAGKQGYQTPCPQCYVFERWVGLGSRLNEITLYQQRYGNLNYEECLDLVKRVDGWLDRAEEIVGSEKKFDNNSTKKAKLVQFFEREGRQEDADLIKAYSWLTGTRVNRKSNKGKVTYSEYKSNKGGFEIVPVDVLYDYNAGDAFAKKYPLSWKYRTSGGSAYGKAIQPYTDERIGEIARGVANTDDVVAKNDKKFTYDDTRAMKSAERSVRSQNLRGGQRMNSTSDFMYAHGLDYLLALIELQALGSNVQLYTKVTESVPMLCAVGADMNISLMPEGRGYIENGDGTRSLLLSSIQGVNYKTAQDLANRFVNAQLIMVGINDIAIKLALSGDAITFVIPYHASGGEAAFVTALMNSLGEAQTSKDFIYDYTKMQSDTLLTDYKSKYSNLSDDEIDGLKTRHERLRKIRQGIISGKAVVNGKRNSTSKENSFALTPDDLALIYDESQHGRPYIEQLLIRFYGVDSLLQEVESSDKGVVMTGKSAEQIFPYEYWDTTSTIETADVNSVRFVEYCESMGIVPRFSGIDSSGKKVTKRVGKESVTYGNFAYEEQEDGTVRPTKGYWKLLIDRPMYNIAYKNGQRIENFGSYRNQQKINVTNLKTDMFVPEFDPQDARMSKRYFVQANTEGADLGNFYDTMTTFYGLMDADANAEIRKINPDDPYQLINEISAGKQVLEQNSVGNGFFAELDSDYLDLAKDPNSLKNQREMRGLVDEAALEWGAVEKDGKPITLYHGTGRFGFTQFRRGNIFLTDSKTTASGYGSNYGYANPRRISDKYIEDDGTAGTLIKNAKSILGQEMREVEDRDIEKVRSEFRKSADTLSEEVNNAWSFGDGFPEPNRRIENGITWMLSLPGTVSENLDDILSGDYSVLDDVKQFEDYREDVQKWFADHKDEIVAAGNEDLYRLITGFKLTDFAIDVAFTLEKAANRDESLVNKIGKLVSKNDVREDIERSKSLGAYSLFANLGSNPLVIDCDGAFWASIPVPDSINTRGERYTTTTSSIADMAKKAGYTGVVFENVYDPSMNNFAVNERSNVYAVFDSSQVKSADLVTYDNDGNVIPLSQRFGDSQDIRYSTGGDFFQYLNEIAKETGAIPPGQGPRRNVVYPKRVPVNGKMQNVSRFNRSAAESPFISDETREENAYQVASGRGTYTPTSNAANMAAAELMRQDYVDDNRSTGYEKAVNRVEYLVSEGNLPTASDIAFAELMIIEADNIGDYETAGRLIAQTAVLGTRLGQAVQALSLIKKLGNNGRLYVLEQEIKDINRSLTDGQRKKIGAVKLSEESRRKILEAKGEKELDDAVLDATKEIGEQIPATFVDKWNAWRYLAMLLNPVTHIRNMASNLAMIPNAVLKNSISRALKNTDRSVVLKDEYKKAAERIMRDSSFEELISGNKYEDNKIRENRKVFNNKFLEWLRVKNSDALSLEDSIFKRFYFKRALAGYMQRHNISPDASVDSLQKGIEFAANEANLNTFNAESKFANWLNKTSKKHWAANIAINGLIPFKRTPINILKQSLAYTPFGMTTIRRSMNRNEVVDTIASSFSGTAMMVIGALLYLNGSLTLKGGKGKDDKFDELQGSQDYSLRIGDRYFSINWLVPASVPMFLGAEFAKLITEWGDIDPQDVFDAVKRTATPVVELSMLQGLTNSVKSIAYSEDGAALIDLGSSMFTNYLSQAFPTIFGKINNTIFEDRTTTYADRNSYIPAEIQRFLQKAAQRIPGAAKVLPKYLDNWGRTDTESNIGWRLLENFIFPGYVSTENTSDMEKELDRLYNETGKSEVLPGDNVKKRNLQVLLDDGTTEKKEVYFTADEYREYNILYKGLAYQSLTELTESDYYKNLSSNEKVTAIKAVWDACKDIADVDIMTTRGMNPYMAKSSQAYFSGIDPVTFSIVNTARDENGNLNMESRRKAMEDLNLNDVFRQVIWNLIYPDAATNYDGSKRYKK